MYLPVRITVRRPNDYKAYRSYPVKNGRVQRNGNDVYNPTSDPMDQGKKVYNYISPGQPKRYENCHTSKSGAGVVYVQTDGINYEGKYTEYAVVDNRLQISVALAYVAVKDPGKGMSEVLFSAYDNCGRICHPSCLNLKTREYERCTGAMRITNPHIMYGNDTMYGNYGKSVEQVWKIGNECPQFKTDNIHLSFFCDYSPRWPWPDALKQKDIQMKVPPHLRRPDPQPGPAQLRNPDLKICKPKGGSSFMSCPIRREQCNAPCLDGETFACTDKCHLYSHCQNNNIYVVRCPRYHNFNPNTKRCDRFYECTVLEPKQTPAPARNRFLDLARLRRQRLLRQRMSSRGGQVDPDPQPVDTTDPHTTDIPRRRGNRRNWRSRGQWRQRNG